VPRADLRVSRAAADAEEARPAPECPFCGSREADLLSLFGTHAMLLQYRCADCGSIYEASKYVAEEPAD
jgi:uncharacterized Zn finger protein